MGVNVLLESGNARQVFSWWSFLTSLYCVERGNTHQGLSQIQDLHQGVLLSARHTLPDRGKTTMEKLRENVIC